MPTVSACFHAADAPVDTARQRIGDDVVAGNTYDKYHTGNPLARYLMNGFMRNFNELLHLNEGERVLEVGCGEGFLMRHMARRYPGITMAGFDLSFGIVHMARHQVCPDISFLQASAYELPWEDESWDVVVACEVLEHLERPGQALKEMRRVCRRGCLVSVPREPFWSLANIARLQYLRHLGNTPGHIQRWGGRDFAELLSRHFDVERAKNPFPWTMIWGTK